MMCVNTICTNVYQTSPMFVDGEWSDELFNEEELLRAGLQ